MRRVFIGLMVIGSVLMLSNTTYAKEKKEKPDATVKLSSGSVAIGIGFSWGSGTLMYKGKRHEFKVDGLSVGEIGGSKAEASGSVYHMKSLEDFNGNYTGVGAGATVGGGGSATVLQNQNGVVLKLVSTTQGLKLKLDVAGVKIQLK